MPRGGGGSSSGSSSHGGFSSHSHSSSSGSRSHSGSSSSHSGSGRSGSYHSGGHYSGGRYSNNYHYNSYRSGGGFGRGYSGGNSGCSGCSGCLGPIIIVAVILIVLSAVYGIFENISLRPSHTNTVEREKLSPTECIPIEEWYRDDWGDWIPTGTAEQKTLLEGLKYFYDMTGVQPYLWITGEKVGASYTSETALEDLCLKEYDRLFTDRGHLLVIFREYPNASGNYITVAYAGASAELVMDAAAREILLDYLDYYYEDTSLSDAEFFSNAFRKAADSIMSVTTTTNQFKTVARTVAIGFLVILAIVIVIIVAVIRKSSNEAKKKKAEADKAQADLNQQMYDDQAAREIISMTCPHCGAMVQLRRGTTEKCKYCNLPVTAPAKDDPFFS